MRRFSVLVLLFASLLPAHAADATVDSILHGIDIRNQIDGQFTDMTIALVKLRDPKVDAVMSPYIKRITTLARQLQQH